MRVEFDLTEVKKLSGLLHISPEITTKALIKAFREIKDQGLQIARSDMASSLKIKQQNTLKAIAGKSSDNRAKNPNQLFVTIYTRSSFVEGHDKGGVITGKGKNLTLFFEYGRGKSGKKRYTPHEFRLKVASGQIKLVPTPRGMLIMERGTVSSTGNFRAGKMNKTKKGYVYAVIGMLMKSVTLKKRLHFYDVAPKLSGIATNCIDAAVDAALVEIAQKQ